MTKGLQQLTPHLWVSQSRFYQTNSGVFLSDGEAVLVDPCMLPLEIDAIVEFVQIQCAAPQWLVLTHSHWDHILGPERFPGVKTIAQANYVQATNAELGARIPKQIAQWEARHNVARKRPFEVPKPDVVFERETTIEAGGLTLKLAHAPGHAADQLVVYHENSATLWASDILSDVEIPYISHDLAAFEETLQKLSGWDVEVLIPGHGNPSTGQAVFRQRVAEDLAYLGQLKDKVTQAIREGRTVKETVDLCQCMAYRNPADNKGPHKLNVESAYVALGGPADPIMVGWNQQPLEEENDAP